MRRFTGRVTRAAFAPALPMVSMTAPAWVQMRMCRVGKIEPVVIKSDAELAKRLSDFQHQFGEARLLIEDAADSVGTTYFEEDLADAKEGTEQAVALYESIIRDCADGTDAGEKRKAGVVAENDMKMQQLKEMYATQQKHVE